MADPFCGKILQLKVTVENLVLYVFVSVYSIVIYDLNDIALTENRIARCFVLLCLIYVALGLGSVCVKDMNEGKKKMKQPNSKKI